MAARWYIVHAYSNFEKKVAEDIENKARQKGLEHLFEKILVPTEKVVEVRRGRKVDSERKFFPGYVMSRKVSSGRRPPLPSRSASRFAFPTARSRRSTARFRMWTKSVRA